MANEYLDKLKDENGNSHPLHDSRITDTNITSWNSKQNKLTFDDEPTKDSTNPVTSSGIYYALGQKEDHIAWGIIGGHVHEINGRTVYAVKADEATDSTNALNDLDGNDIRTTYATKSELKTVTELVPTDASSTNQLATKAYADAIGERLEARYLGCNADGYPFPTYEALSTATTYYYQGQETTPDTNDITTVTNDENHLNDLGVASTTRYRWGGTSWSFEYVINNTGLSESQLLAVNSTITKTKVDKYDALKNVEVSSSDNSLNISKTTSGDTTTFDIKDEKIFLATVGVTTALELETAIRAGKQICIYSSGQQSGTTAVYQGKIIITPVSVIIELSHTHYNGGVSGYYVQYSNWTAFTQPAIGTVGSSSIPIYADNGTLKECGPTLQMSSSTKGTEVSLIAARQDKKLACILFQDDTTAGIRNNSGNIIVKNSTDDIVKVPNWSNTGNSSKPIYFNSNGYPTEVSSILHNRTPAIQYKNTEGSLYYFKLATNISDSSKYANYGVSFKLGIVTVSTCFSANGNIFYRRNNGVVATPKAWLQFDNVIPNNLKYYAYVRDALTKLEFSLIVDASLINYVRVSIYPELISNLSDAHLTRKYSAESGTYTSLPSGTGYQVVEIIPTNSVQSDSHSYKIVVGSVGTSSNTLYFI